jgi:uncharacterized repeat protein (TIGR01451 family)
VGQSLTYDFAISNDGPDGATGVILNDAFPGTRFVSISASQGSCTVNAKQRTVTCDLGNLANDASITVRLVVRPEQVGPITNSVSVSANEPDSNQTNNSDSETTSVV